MRGAKAAGFGGCKALRAETMVSNGTQQRENLSRQFEDGLLGSDLGADAEG